MATEYSTYLIFLIDFFPSPPGDSLVLGGGGGGGGGGTVRFDWRFIGVSIF